MRITKQCLVLAGALLGLILAAPGAAHAAVSCGTPDSTNTSGCHVDPVIDPGALCNDGTAPVFSFRPGSGQGASTWIIWLEGGGDCVDATSCAERAASPTTAPLLTSTGWVPTDGVGVLAPTRLTNPSLYNANTVIVHYCSSDLWAGGYSAPTGSVFTPTNPASWNFLGHRIALAALRSLLELPGSLASAKRVLIGGDSAGGEGATMNLNDFLPLLPVVAQVLLVNDAGFALDIGQYDSTAARPYVFGGSPNAFVQDQQSEFSLWTARGDVKCAATAKTETAQLNCLNSAYVIQNGYVAVPSFVAESQIDQAQLGFELCPTLFGQCALPTSKGSHEGIYATYFGTQMAALLQASSLNYGVVSPDAYMHVILDDSTEFNTPFRTPGGRTTPRTVFDQWLANPSGARVAVYGNGPGV